MNLEIGNRVLIDNKTIGEVVYAEDGYTVVRLSNGSEQDFEGYKRLKQVEDKKFDIEPTDPKFDLILEQVERSKNPIVNNGVVSAVAKNNLAKKSLQILGGKAADWNDLNSYQKLNYILLGIIGSDRSQITPEKLYRMKDSEREEFLCI